MCGFVAIISKEIINKNVSQTFNQLVKINKHRGPDKIKSFNEKNIQ